MRILLFNTNNPLKEAGVVSLDLFNQLKDKGHEVRLMVNAYNDGYPDGVISMETSSMLWRRKWMEKLKWRYDKIKNFFFREINTDSNYCFFVLDEKESYYRTGRILRRARLKPDAIFVLYAKNFLNIKNIYELHRKTKAPVYWILYDMAAFTGGCHYAWDCTGYLKSCGTCPALFSDDPSDISHLNMLFKRKYIEKTDIHLIAGSEWQFRQAKMSSLFRGKPVHKVLISMDPELFKPADKETLRKKMGIASGKKVIFFGSLQLKELRKGMSYLFESLKILQEIIRKDNPSLEDRIVLLIAGRGIDAFANDLPFNYHYMGMVTSTEIATAYQAADVFISPSIEDSGPSMINQSLMCGTPVVSFEMGVSLDLVITGKTGHRAKLRDSRDMGQGIYNIVSLGDEDYNELKKNCRDLSMELYSPEARIQKIQNILTAGEVN